MSCAVCRNTWRFRRSSRGWAGTSSRPPTLRAGEVKEMLVRKDLAWTGVVGRPRFGYPIHGLIGAILDVVGWNRLRPSRHSRGRLILF